MNDNIKPIKRNNPFAAGVKASKISELTELKINTLKLVDFDKMLKQMPLHVLKNLQECVLQRDEKMIGKTVLLYIYGQVQGLVMEDAAIHRLASKKDD